MMGQRRGSHRTDSDLFYTGCLGVVGSIILIALGLFSGWFVVNLLCLGVGLLVLLPSLILVLLYR